MEIHERREGNILILELRGRLDHAGAGIFQELVLKKISEGARSIIADLGGTGFVASMGIRALMVPAQELSRNHGRFAISGLSADVLRLFETSGLLKLFPVFPTAAEAAADGVWP